MEAVFSRRNLLEPSELKTLNQKSDLRGWLQLLSHLGVVFFASYLHAIAMGTWWVLITGFVLGVFLNFLYAAQHELSHSTVFRNRKMNEVWGRIIGFLMFFPRDFDQIMHFAHHQYTGDWEKDGELVREPFTFFTYLLWFLSITYWKNRILGICRRAFGVVLEPFVRREEEKKIIIESRLHLFFYLVIIVVSISLDSWVWLTFWVLPLFLTKPVHQLQNTIEHLGLTHESDILENTRSTKTNAMMRWLCWQMPYHTAHHTFPSVPFWNLKKLNQKIEQKVGALHKMGWIEFQIEVFKRLLVKDESQYPTNEVWIISKSGGRNFKIPSEG